MKNNIKKYFNSLSFKINMMIVILFAVFIISSHMWIINVFGNLIRTTAKERGNNIAMLFAKVSRLPLLRMDYSTLRINIDELRGNADIVFVGVYDKNGESLYFGNEDLPVSKDVMVFNADILDYQDKKIGYVKIMMSSKKVEDKIKHLSKVILFVMGIMILTTMFILSYFLRKFISIPLKDVVESANIISSGNFSHTINIKSNDEIGQLADAFNFMTFKLREILSLLKGIVKFMPSILISMDDNYKITLWNAAAEDFTGIKNDDVIGKILWDVIPEFKKYKSSSEEVLKTRKSAMFHKEYFDLLGKNGIYTDVHIFPVVEENIRGLVMRIDDITDIEKKDEQLQQAQKMETIGTLAGGLAHDFNNILSGIIGTLSILKYKIKRKKLTSSEDFIKSLEPIEVSANRAADMVQQLLALSRKHELTFEPVDLNVVLEHVFKIYKNSFDKSIELKSIYYNEPAIVEADITQLEQVFLNLCVNSAHAMTIMRPKDEPRGGILSVKIDKIRADTEFIKTHPEAKEEYYWKASVEDTGVGIDSSLLSRIFDPFFTTKGKGVGTGLGLSMVYNIIKQHNGFIDVYSEKGIGTTFNVYLPVFRTEIETKYGNPYSNSELKKGNGKILIIDDEQIVRDTARTILEECGYEVLEADNGNNGIEIFKKEHENIDAVLLDMVMPKKSGKEVFMVLKKINPNIKVVLSSGFRRDERVEEIMNLGACAFLQKPYTLIKLSNVMSEIIKKDT